MMLKAKVADILEISAAAPGVAKSQNNGALISVLLWEGQFWLILLKSAAVETLNDSSAEFIYCTSTYEPWR